MRIGLGISLVESGRASGSSLTLPAYLSSTAPAVLEGFEASADWTVVSGGSVSDDTGTARFSQGAQSVKITQSAASTTIRKTITGTVFSGSAYDVQAVDFYAYNLVGHIKFGFFTSSALSKGMLASVVPTRVGWNRYLLPRSLFTAQGGGAWTDTQTQLAVQITAGANTDAVSVDNWQYNITPVGAAAWVMHDADDSQYSDGYPEFSSRGLVGSLAYPTSVIGTGGKVTYAQMRAMIAAGWSPVNKFQNNVDSTGYSVAQVETEIDAAQTDLNANSIDTPTELITPSGIWSDNHRTAALARSMIWGHSPLDARKTSMPNPETTQPEGYDFEGVALATLEAALLDAKNAGGLIVPYFHAVDPVNSVAQTSIKLSDLQAMLDYCVTQQLPCITMHQAALLNSGQAVTVHVPW